MGFLPLGSAAGSLTNNGSFINIKKITLNAARLTAFTSISRLTAPEASGPNAVTSFLSFTTMNGQNHSWSLPFFEGDSVRDITVFLGTGGTSLVEAVHILTIAQPFNGALSSPEIVLHPEQRKGVMVYKKTTGATQLLYEVSDFTDGDLPDHQAMEEEALRLTQEHLGDTRSTAVIPVDLLALKKGVSYEVDLVSKTLKEIQVHESKHE